MKTIIWLVVAAFITAAGVSATQKATAPEVLSSECYVSCFTTDVTEQFRMNDVNAAFASWHPTPKAFKLQNATGKMVQYQSADGTTAQAYEIKAAKKTNNYLLVIQEWWGLNDHIKAEAEKLAADLGNVNVLAIDMYDGRVAATPDSAMAYMRSTSTERLQTIVKATLAYAGPKANIYTIGWCFGGMWSLQTALLAGSQAKGCVMYYGRPENNIEKLKQLNCDVIGSFGLKDRMPNVETVQKFQADMATAGKQLAVHNYDAGHGFSNPSNPNFNQEATADAYAKTLAYLKSKLK
jgi:carboxymethylenebutenolidase